MHGMSIHIEGKKKKNELHMSGENYFKKKEKMPLQKFKRRPIQLQRRAITSQEVGRNVSKH